MEDQKAEELWYQTHRDEIEAMERNALYPCCLSSCDEPPTYHHSKTCHDDFYIPLIIAMLALTQFKEGQTDMKDQRAEEAWHQAHRDEILIREMLNQKQKGEKIIMNNSKFECSHEDECLSRAMNPNSCSKCKNNKKRNYMPDYFVEAKDENIPDHHINAEDYVGPIDQTAGYECPICHGYTSPYALTKEKTCKHCGYRLFL